jgi:UDP-2,3-diacylglucosamine pyrophosphatase LpxH
VTGSDQGQETSGDRSEALRRAIELAPHCRTLREVGERVNDVLDIDISEAAWRGILNRAPDTKERCYKLLGVALPERQRYRTVNISGDVRGLVTNDVHVPYHDANAVKLAIKVLAWWQPSVHIANGDHLDCYNLSHYDKNPARVYRLQDEIDQWHVDVIAPLKAATKRARWIFLPGNHEDRLRKHLWRHPELFGVKALELPNLLELDRYGIEYAEQSVTFDGVLEVSHGTRVNKWAGASAKAEQELRRYSISTITGHVHRAGRFQTHGVIGQESPCLCSLEPEYLIRPDWVQGLTLFEIKDGRLHVEAVQFNRDYTCIVGGRMVGL